MPEHAQCCSSHLRSCHQIGQPDAATNVSALATITPGAANLPPGVALGAAPGLSVAYSLSEHATVCALSAGTTFFPRRPPVADAADFFRRLDAMQVRRGTFHAGGCLTGWNVEQAWRSGLDAADRVHQ